MPPFGLTNRSSDPNIPLENELSYPESSSMTSSMCGEPTDKQGGRLTSIKKRSTNFMSRSITGAKACAINISNHSSHKKNFMQSGSSFGGESGVSADDFSDEGGKGGTFDDFMSGMSEFDDDNEDVGDEQPESDVEEEDEDDDDDDDDSFSSDGYSGDRSINLHTRLARLGENPSAEDLAVAAGEEAESYLEECLSAEVSVVNREKFNAIPEIVKSDLVIGKHLGKGCFSDVFEISLSQKSESLMRHITPCSLAADAEDLNELLKNFNTEDEGEGDKVGMPAPMSIQPNPRRRASRRSSLSSSICVGSQGRPSMNRPERLDLAMKCLRPQIRSNAEQFLIGVHDLIHETAILSSLDHKHIIKLHGRAGGSLSNAFKLNDGYFIALDRLQNTLDDRIDQWKKASPKIKKPTLNQLKVACATADALSYLHSNNIVFRDLKPANVGFNATGVLKLFDFGFAAELQGDDGVLHEKAGTPRYMAPEVGLEKGYGKEADVYSFGILFWEICSLKKPFGKVKSADEFHKTVFVKGARPKLGKGLPDNLKDLMSSCWATDPNERPSMSFVTTMLTANVKDLQSKGGDGVSASSRRQKMMKRFTWDI